MPSQLRYRTNDSDTMRGKKSRRTSGVTTDKGGDFRWLKITERTAVGQRPVNEEGKETGRECFVFLLP